MITLPVILFAVIGGIANRVRGGLLNLPSLTLGRILVGISFASMMFVATNNWRVAGLSGFGIFLGLLNGWGSFMDMGRNTIQYNKDNPPISWIVGKEDNTRPFYKRWLRDFIGMSLRGVLMYLPISILLYMPTNIPFWSCLFGLHMGIFYEIDAQLSDRGITEYTRKWRELIGAEFFMGFYTFAIWFLMGILYR